MREKTKSSFGIACCRFNTGRPEILLVCKRYTYAYNLFINARYNSSDNAAIIALFNGMTVDEKLTILSLNFAQIWYKVWLGSTNNAVYYTAKNKFETTFLPDGGARLRRLINRSTNSALLWEIPKGKRKFRAEQDLHCAIREFTEETGVAKKYYRVIPWAKRTHSYIDTGVKYVNTYYLALEKQAIAPQINFGRPGQVAEICDLRWMNIDQIRLIDQGRHLEEVVAPIFKFVKRYVKQR